MSHRHTAPTSYDWNRYSQAPKRNRVKRFLSGIPTKRLVSGVVAHIGSAVVAVKNSEDIERIAQASRDAKDAFSDAFDTLDILLTDDNDGNDIDSDMPLLNPRTGLMMVTNHMDIGGNFY